jgi:hypothetical protein
MITENELTQHPELYNCVASGRVISDHNLPDMKGFYPVVDRTNWQIKGFVYADDPAAIAEYVWASWDDGKIYECDADHYDAFLVEPN